MRLDAVSSECFWKQWEAHGEGFTDASFWNPDLDIVSLYFVDFAMCDWLVAFLLYKYLMNNSHAFSTYFCIPWNAETLRKVSGSIFYSLTKWYH